MTDHRAHATPGAHGAPLVPAGPGSPAGEPGGLAPGHPGAGPPGPRRPTTAERVEELLGRLTTDERVALLHQYAPAVARVGLAAFRTGQEALHGVAWAGTATVLPQAVGLGATWDAELLHRAGEMVGTEIRAKRRDDTAVGLNVWSPTVNLLRHPLWGRGEEGYSEDPAHTAAMATAYTRGLRGDHPEFWRTAPVLKHWLAHNNETRRDTTSSSVRPRVLHEYDLRAFRRPVRAGAVAGVMPAYNLVNGRPNHLSPLLAGELRRWTELPLVVCSDAGAPSNLVDSEHYLATHAEATAAALRAGVDSFTDHGDDPTTMTARLHQALDLGLIDRGDIDTAVRRLLHMRFLLGEFDPEDDPWTAGGAVDRPAHRALAREAAEKAVVLLRNDGLLPLTEARQIAVVGPLADSCRLDWYSGTPPYAISPLDGIRARYGSAAVRHHDGNDRIRLRTTTGGLHVPDPADVTEPATPGSAAAPPEPTPGTTPADPTPADLPPAGTTSAEPQRVVEGTADEATELVVDDWGDGVLTLRLPGGPYLAAGEDGVLRASSREPGGWIVRETFRLLPVPGETVRPGHEAAEPQRLLHHLASGGHLCLTPEGGRVATPDGTPLGVEQATVLTVETTLDGVAAAATEAGNADTVVVVTGNDPHVNGRETEDRTTLRLPEHQQRLWRAVHDINSRTVLVLCSSYPYAVPEADAALPALLWTAHGGQEAGSALARVLAGDVSPAGRLPQTWYARDTDLPDLLDYDIIGSRQTYLYSEATPLYAFGHGLSYTTFRYGTPTVTLAPAGTDPSRSPSAPAPAPAPAPDDPTGGAQLHISCEVTNTGGRTADEVVQFYGRAHDPHVPRPKRQLLDFSRVRIKAGATVRVSATVELAELGHWDTARRRWTVTAGRYAIDVGAASDDIRATTTLDVPGEAPIPHPAAVRGLAAADYDEQWGTELVDLSRTDGDAVAPADPGAPGRLLFRNCDIGAAAAVTARAAGRGTVTVQLLPAGDGGLSAPADAGAARIVFDDASPDRYVYRERTARLPGAQAGAPAPGGSADARRDVLLTLDGGLRLDRIALHAEEPPARRP
ncbi:glycoside hydrolase family 3 C-terminal domain-containing protein [Streptomyces lonarensis]|uniref:Sugar hydrolase n=1 Tax=Streptomyces lonarensis TaxID=700599 RepID=A0A7X6CY36_9ACTN|nr:glycoside hydrolase family 3 C-terminal domain-containing protein [Streptomyces lonarensis]NJQ04697.1 sugar hydrolase [Streptomyces lonarensis]